MVPQLWKSLATFLISWNIHFSHNPVIEFLGIYPTDMKICVHTCTLEFVGLCLWPNLRNFQPFFWVLFQLCVISPFLVRLWILALWWLNHKSVSLLFYVHLFPLCQIGWFLLVSLQVHWFFSYLISVLHETHPVSAFSFYFGYCIFSVLTFHFGSSFHLYFIVEIVYFLICFESFYHGLLEHVYDSCLKILVWTWQPLCHLSVGIC